MEKILGSARPNRASLPAFDRLTGPLSSTPGNHLGFFLATACPQAFPLSWPRLFARFVTPNLAKPKGYQLGADWPILGPI
jgi:hypothetical protein